MPNPTNNDFENWTSGLPDNWTKSGGEECNQSTDSYSGTYACELNIPSPSYWSGQYVSVKSENFILGNPFTFYANKPVSSGSLDTYYADLVVYIKRASDNVTLYSISYADDDLSSSYQQKTIDTAGNVGVEAYCIFSLRIPAICLPDSTLIEIEKGKIKITDIKIGDIVIGGKVLKIIKYPTPIEHKYYKFITEDGEVIASKGHPFKSKVLRIELVNLKSKYTCDILTETGLYKVNGVWVKSTLGNKKWP